MNYLKLQSELIQDPLGIGYSTMSDNEAANALATTIRVITPENRLTALGIMRVLGTTVGSQLLDDLEVVAASNPAVKWAMKQITGSGVDVGDPLVRGMLDNLKSASLVQAEAADGIKSYAEKQVTRAEEIGLTGTISAQMIGIARGGVW